MYCVCCGLWLVLSSSLGQLGLVSMGIVNLSGQVLDEQGVQFVCFMALFQDNFQTSQFFSPKNFLLESGV